MNTEVEDKLREQYARHLPDKIANFRAKWQAACD